MYHLAIIAYMAMAIYWNIATHPLPDFVDNDVGHDIVYVYSLTKLVEGCANGLIC